MSRSAGLVADVWRWARGTRRPRDEQGYVAILLIMTLSSVLIAGAAIGVDVGRWYLEAQRIQKAADAAALGSVTYLPQDLASAKTTAVDIAARNGYPIVSGKTTVSADVYQKPSQIKVEVCSNVHNAFGAVIGVSSIDLCRVAVADYTGPAPMGSPCNTFGNEPPSGSTTAASPTGTSRGASPLGNCPANPEFWATVEGPETDKVNGDRYQTTDCTGTDGCASGKNTEYDPEGYFWLVRVQPSGVGHSVDLQLFDPEFAYGGKNDYTGYQDCQGLPAASSWSNAANPYVTDAKTRYSTNSATGSAPGVTPVVVPTCSGDLLTEYPVKTLPTTSFALRQQTDTLNPRKAPVQNDTAGAPCIKQYTGFQSVYSNKMAPGTAELNEKVGSNNSTTYNRHLAQTFHNWNSLCTFTPARAGDYYLQVRTNVSATGPMGGQSNSLPAIMYKGNTNVLAATGNTTTGEGNNAFAIRAVTENNLEKSVSVSGYDRMPIYANATGAASTLNLIRVLPGGAGKSIAFSYYDVGDISASSGTGSVQVQVPPDATGTITTTPFPNGGCKASGGYAGTSSSLTNCKANFTAGTGSGNVNNGHTETIIIPIPSDYTCNYTLPQNCWYRVTVSLPGTAPVNDITTWTANLFGDPVRLIE